VNRQQFPDVFEAPYPLVLLTFIIVAAYPVAAQESSGGGNRDAMATALDVCAYAAGRSGSPDSRMISTGNNSGYNGNQDACASRLLTDLVTRMTEGPVVNDDMSSFGSSWADYDDDADPDLFVTTWWSSGFQANCFCENDGAGAFTRVVSRATTVDGNSLGTVRLDFDGAMISVLCGQPAT
jgi:hypothetical protein